VSVVDDDRSVRVALERLLRSIGYAVRTFPSSQNFLENGECKGPGCLILDVQMPGMNGLDLEEKLIADGSNLSVVYITAFDEPEARARAKRQGALAFLTKPVDEKQLMEAVNAALGIHDASHH
jgi:FixJ family two-component response regulator